MKNRFNFVALLLVVLFAGAPETWASTAQNRVWQTCAPAVETVLEESPRFIEAHRESPVFDYDFAWGQQSSWNSDPAGFAGGMNWFAYSSGDPVNLFDPLGLGPADSERNMGSASRE